jgi:inorganic pyrophosphatase
MSTPWSKPRGSGPARVHTRKPLIAGLTYLYDSGFIPSTKPEDGDPLYALVMHDARTYLGVVLLQAYRNS